MNHKKPITESAAEPKPWIKAVADRIMQRFGLELNCKSRSMRVRDEVIEIIADHVPLEVVPVSQRCIEAVCQWCAPSLAPNASIGPAMKNPDGTWTHTIKWKDTETIFKQTCLAASIRNLDMREAVPVSQPVKRSGVICGVWKRLDDGCVARCDQEDMHRGDHLDSVIDIAWRGDDKADQPAKPVQSWMEAAIEEIARAVEPCLPYTWTKQTVLRILAAHVPQIACGCIGPYHSAECKYHGLDPAEGTFNCPICGVDSPHEHTGTEIAEFRVAQDAVPVSQPAIFPLPGGRVQPRSARMVELGKVAYEAFFKHCDGKSLITCASLPQWQDQAEYIRTAWNLAAEAVIAEVTE